MGDKVFGILFAIIIICSEGLGQIFVVFIVLYISYNAQKIMIVIKKQL